MRFIIREMAYERPLAAGRLVYRQDGRATGALESWRLTDAVDDYRVLRVDLDAREAASGDSYLYHAVLNPAGRVERLKLRFFGRDRQLSADVLPEADSLAWSCQVGRDKREKVLNMPPGYLFWFPASLGLGLLAGLEPGDYPAVTLNKDDDFSPRAVTARVSSGPKEEMAVGRQMLAVRPLSIQWSDQERTIWLDEHGWPVQMVRGDGLQAVEKRYVRFQQPSLTH